MVYRSLGQTGLTVSRIGLGTTKLGRNTDVKYPKAFELPSKERIGELLDTALRSGVNLIDTAPAYGASEARLGAFVGSRRERFVLSTKCGEQYSDGRSLYDFSARALEASIETSLSHLQVDHVDILLLHSDGRDVEILTETDALKTLAGLKRKGKARAIGISAKTPEGIREACRTLDVVMAPFSQKDPSLEKALREAHKAGLGVLAIKGLSSGYLKARPAIEFVLQQEFVDALIVGTTDPQHLSEAVSIAEDVVQRIESAPH
ncbi:MAG TPA: aldo/keto reductase [Candidatus Binatia bacterium]|nr:aldo/keto reductase [Candidatus Binatia bacterium]